MDLEFIDFSFELTNSLIILLYHLGSFLNDIGQLLALGFCDLSLLEGLALVLVGLFDALS